ncbi:PD-(D/E)XK nuclease transposase family protein [Orientia tsutsugamushi str. TA763]|nr:PD-(D/E)XK nuclease transposase family protein [Orientia tsutsugamushi str. TA763]
MDKKTYEHDLKDFSFTFIELPKFKKNRVEELNDITEKWCYFFKHAKETTLDGYNKIIGEDLIIKRAYEALDQFNWSEDELITYEQELKRIWDNKAVEDYKLERAKVETIAEYTDLSIQEVLNLKNNRMKTLSATFAFMA